MRDIYESPHRCSACGCRYSKKRKAQRYKTRHHIYPRRWFGKWGPTIDLCQKCHQEIETRIPRLVRKSKEWYDRVLESFLRETRRG